MTLHNPKDPRYKHLGKILKIDWRLARSICVDIFEECTERCLYELKPALIDAIAEIDGFANAMIEAELARPEGPNGVYICGSVGRVEWLSELRSQRESKSKGGKARAENAKRDGHGQFLPRNAPAEPAEDQQATSTTPAESSYHTKANIRKEDHDPPAPAGDGGFEFEKLASKYPRSDVGMEAGIAEAAKQVKTEADYLELSRAIDVYRCTMEYEEKELRFILSFKSFMRRTKNGRDEFPWREWAHKLPPGPAGARASPKTRLEIREDPVTGAKSYHEVLVTGPP